MLKMNWSSRLVSGSILPDDALQYRTSLGMREAQHFAWTLENTAGLGNYELAAPGILRDFLDPYGDSGKKVQKALAGARTGGINIYPVVISTTIPQVACEVELKADGRTLMTFVIVWDQAGQCTMAREV